MPESVLHEMLVDTLRVHAELGLPPKGASRWKAKSFAVPEQGKPARKDQGATVKHQKAAVRAERIT
jgi:hypothetical protein